MKDQKVSTILGTIILMIIAATVATFILLCIKNSPIKTDVVPVMIQPRLSQEINEQTEEVRSSITKENVILKSVDFCGTKYISEELVINHVDIIDAIAKISEKNDWLCKRLELGKYQESGISLLQKTETSEDNSFLIVIFNKDDLIEKNDPFNQSPDIFRFDFKNNQIFYQSQIDAKFNLLGKIL